MEKQKNIGLIVINILYIVATLPLILFSAKNIIYWIYMGDFIPIFGILLLILFLIPPYIMTILYFIKKKEKLLKASIIYWISLIVVLFVAL